MTIVLFMKTDFKANAHFTILKNLPISNPSMKGVNFWKIMELVGRFPSNTCNTPRWYHHDGSVHGGDGKDDNWDDNTDEQNGSDHTICNLNESVCKTQEVNKVKQNTCRQPRRKGCTKIWVLPCEEECAAVVSHPCQISAALLLLALVFYPPSKLQSGPGSWPTGSAKDDAEIVFKIELTKRGSCRCLKKFVLEFSVSNENTLIKISDTQNLYGKFPWNV